MAATKPNTTQVEGIVLNKNDLGSIIFIVLQGVKDSTQLMARKDLSEPSLFNKLKNIKKNDYCCFDTLSQNDDQIIDNVVTHIKSECGTHCQEKKKGLLQAYSFILNTTREFFLDQDYCEVRLPSILPGQVKSETFEIDFFGQEARLSSSNALYMDICAVQLHRAFSIQRMFRAEKSHTSKHLAEFDMLESARMNFTLEETMSLLEDFLKFLVQKIFYSPFSPMCSHTLGTSTGKSFPRLDYKDISTKYKLENKGLGKYERDIASGGPLFVVNFPRTIASWTARPIDSTYSRSFNLLLPGVGEVAEGTEKQTRSSVLEMKLKNAGMDKQLNWYRTMNPYSDFNLSAFGMGLERLAMWLLDCKNIRELPLFYRDTKFSEITVEEK